jgi:hypothetical protein
MRKMRMIYADITFRFNTQTANDLHVYVQLEFCQMTLASKSYGS